MLTVLQPLEELLVLLLPLPPSLAGKQIILQVAAGQQDIIPRYLLES